MYSRLGTMCPCTKWRRKSIKFRTFVDPVFLATFVANWLSRDRSVALVEKRLSSDRSLRSQRWFELQMRLRHTRLHKLKGCAVIVCDMTKKKERCCRDVPLLL